MQSKDKWTVSSEDSLYYEISDSSGTIVAYVVKLDDKQETENNLKRILE